MMLTSSSKNSWYSRMKKWRSGVSIMVSLFSRGFTDCLVMSRPRLSRVYSAIVHGLRSSRTVQEESSSSPEPSRLLSSSLLISESSSRIYLIPPSSIATADSFSRRWQRQPTLILRFATLVSHSSTILTSPLRSVDIQTSRYTASSRSRSEVSSHQSESVTTRHSSSEWQGTVVNEKGEPRISKGQ